MELLDRYLRNVRFWLPDGQKEDIMAELTDDLRAVISDRESEVGRALTEVELVEVLKRRGNPMLVASRYLPQRSFIGAAWLPAYYRILRLTLLWALPALYFLVLAPLRLLTGGPVIGTLVGTALSFSSTAVFAFGIITIVFALLERFSTGCSHDWDPRTLPAFPAPEPRRNLDAKRRNNAIYGLTSAVIAWAVWAWFLGRPGPVNLGAFSVIPLQIWYDLGIPVLILYILALPPHVVTLFAPRATTVQWTLRIVGDAYSLGILALLYLAGRWFEVDSLALSSAQVGTIAYWMNMGCRLTLLMIAAGTVGQLIVDAYRAYHRARADSPGLPLSNSFS